MKKISEEALLNIISFTTIIFKESETDTLEIAKRLKADGKIELAYDRVRKLYAAKAVKDVNGALTNPQDHS